MIEWKSFSLGDVCKFIDYRGKTPPKVKSGVPLVTAKIIKNGFIQEPKEFIAEDFYSEWMRRGIPKKGDIVFTTEAPLGEVAQIKTDRKLAFAQRVIILESDNDILCSSYLFYALRDKKLKSRIEARQSGTTVSGIKASELKKVEIDLPPLETQKKIAAVLSALDDKIELNNAINKNLEEQAQAIFKSWFIDFEPFGGTMPDDWRQGKVEEIIIFHDSKRIPLSANERNKMKNIYPYYGATSIMDYVEDYIFNGIFLLFAEDGTVIDDKGFPILQYVEGKFWVNNHAHILTGQLGFSVETLYLLFKTMNINSIITGAVQQKVSQSNLKRIPVTVPSYKDLIKFDKIISPMFEMIRSLRTENKKLGELRDALLPRLMSGEVDVSAVKI